MKQTIFFQSIKVNMAGRGRGRGRGGRGMSLPMESLGFGRGEALPGPILQPPATFPVSISTCQADIFCDNRALDTLVLRKHVVTATVHHPKEKEW